MGSVFEYSEPDALDDVFASGGEMGELMRTIDWSQTTPGPVENWPQSLRTALSICLTSQFPILIWWGPELVMLYNDAYRPVLGTTKHPRSMGQRGRECWPEIWDVIGPMLESVFNEGKATWSDNQLLLLDRNGYIEECYFTFSYSPIRDESGGIGGVFTAVTETTRQVLGERRLRTLRELAAHTTEAQSAREACVNAAETLAMNQDDIPFSLLYLLDKDGKHTHLAGSSGVGSGLLASLDSIDTEKQEGEDAQWPLSSIIQTGKAEMIDDLHQSFDLLASYPGLEAVHKALVLPIVKSGQESLYGLLVVGVSRRLALDEEYRGFFDLVAGQVAASIEHARSYQNERARSQALTELNNAKTIFFSNVSHEFRTPLTLLLSPAEEALNDSEHPLPAVQRERVEIIRRNSLRLLKLVNILLDFSRIEAGRIQPTYEATDLATFTADIASTFRAVVERAGLKLEIQCALLSEPVYVDREMWEKILLNLLSNAFKFTLTGSITVKQQQIDHTIELSVIDTGVGIAEEDLPRIFERFRRLRVAQARTFEGSGIGLALVQELVQLQGGSIQVNSSPGKGTTFRISLPMRSAHETTERVTIQETQLVTTHVAVPYVEEALRWLPGTEEPGKTRIDGRQGQDSTNNMPAPKSVPEQAKRQTGHILLVDDNTDMQEYLKRLLSKNYTVDIASNGLSALKIAREHVPDLILSDVMMPGLDGIQLVQELRKEPFTRSLPIILLSARAGEEATVEGLAIGADDYLTKPFSARELLTRVSTQLEMARMRLGMASKERAHAERLQQLAQASIAINSMLSIEELFALITTQARTIIGAHMAFTNTTIDPESAQTSSSISLSEKYADVRNLPIAISDIYGAIARTNQPLRMTQKELEAHPNWQEAEYKADPHIPLRGLLVAPLIARDGRNLGLLQLSDKYEGEFTDEDEAVLIQLAQMASIAIENAHLYQQAQESIRARDQLLSMVSHDLKNPLGAIKGYAQLLQKGLSNTNTPESARLLTGLTRIDATVSRMTAQINELLDLSYLHVGQSLELVRHEADLIALTRQVVAEQQQTTRRHQIRIETTEQKLRGFFDSGKLERVISNLLSNAIKYSPDNNQIDIKIEREEAEGKMCALLSVQDRGIGIPAADLPYIFEQFRRAENVIGKIKGTGIGLASARQIIQLHGGTITVKSKEGTGSTFIVCLPLTTPDSEIVKPVLDVQ